MTTPTPDEFEAAQALQKYLAELMVVRYQIPTVRQLANWLSAHCAKPSAVPARELETAAQNVLNACTPALLYYGVSVTLSPSDLANIRTQLEVLRTLLDSKHPGKKAEKL